MSKPTMIEVFNEWNRRYAKAPNEFRDTLDCEGKPFADYGEHCTVYYQKLERELSKITPPPVAPK